MNRPDRAILSRRATLRLTLAAPLAVAGCGGTPVQTVFPPLTYDYLTKLRLDVSAIEIDDSWNAQFGATQIGALSPVRPAAALRQMAQDRLVAAGESGRAIFKIQDATISQIRSRLQASFAVQLSLSTTDGTRSGYAEARVVRSSTLLDDDAPALRAALYQITKATMDDMNVELEFQVRRSLRDHLVADDTVGTAPPPPPVQQQDLGPRPPRLILTPPSSGS
jgi:hypothetical protein